MSVRTLTVDAEEDAGWERWAAFVGSHPRAVLGHAPQWRSVFRQAYGKRCFYLLCEQAGSIEGVLPLVQMRGPLAGNRLVSLPFLDQAGILARMPQAAEALHQRAFELAAKLGAGGVDLREAAAGTAPSGAATRFRFRLPLPPSEDQLWQKVGAKVRNQIRKSRRCELSTRREGFAQLSSFYRVFARNMRDLGSPVHSLRFFSRIGAVFGDAAALYLTSDASGEPVAGAVALRFGRTVSVLWASSLRSHRRQCPNHSLYWEILRDSRERGALEFDFGRSSLGTGTFHFKKQWGADPTPLAWVSLSPSGEAQPDRALDPHRRAILANIWSRLPLALANRLGPKLRRHLPQ